MHRLMGRWLACLLRWQQMQQGRSGQGRAGRAVVCGHRAECMHARTRLAAGLRKVGTPLAPAPSTGRECTRAECRKLEHMREGGEGRHKEGEAVK